MRMAKRKERKYIRGFVAALRLISVAMDHALTRNGVTVSWELKVWRKYSAEALAESKAVAIPTVLTFTSGDEIIEL
jgi:hypothetical protein